MARDPNPLSGVPYNERYDGAEQGRYHDEVDFHRGDGGTFNHVAVTLEDEVKMGGWLPNNRPTGPEPRDLWTTGMRGEPQMDDDPAMTPDGQVSHSD